MLDWFFKLVKKKQMDIRPFMCKNIIVYSPHESIIDLNSSLDKIVADPYSSDVLDLLMYKMNVIHIQELFSYEGSMLEDTNYHFYKLKDNVESLIRKINHDKTSARATKLNMYITPLKNLIRDIEEVNR